MVWSPLGSSFEVDWEPSDRFSVTTKQLWLATGSDPAHLNHQFSIIKPNLIFIIYFRTVETRIIVKKKKTRIIVRVFLVTT